MQTLSPQIYALNNVSVFQELLWNVPKPSSASFSFAENAMTFPQCNTKAERTIFIKRVQEKLSEADHATKINLRPLKAVLRVFSESRPLPLQTCVKSEGYFRRFFSSENWQEWTEDKTALGRVVSLFSEFRETPAQQDAVIGRLNVDVIKAANQQAAVFLHPKAKSGPTPQQSYLKWTYAYIRTAFTSLNAHLSFPVAAAATVPLEELRKMVGALENVVISEDMVKRIIEDKTGTDIESDVVKAVKYIINLLGSAANPSNVYGNLIQDGLETAAIEKLKEVAALRQKYDQQLEAILSKNKKDAEKSHLNYKRNTLVEKIRLVEIDEDSKGRTADGIRKERDERLADYASEQEKIDLWNKMIDMVKAQLKNPASRVAQYQQSISECSQRASAASDSAQRLTRALGGVLQEQQNFASQRLQLQSELREINRQIDHLKDEL